MKDFYEQFRENLENRPETDYQQNWWDRLEHDLNKEEQKRPKGGAWWWAAAAALLLLLLGTNALFFMELQKSNERLASLEMRTDTVYQTKIIYQTDTIYQTRTISEKTVPPNTSFTTSIPYYKQQPYTKFNPNNFNFLNKNAEAVLPDAPSSTSSLLAFHRQKKTGLGKDLASANLDSKALQQLGDFDILPVEILPLSRKRKEILPLIDMTYTATKQRKTIGYYLFAMRPKEFIIGVTAGRVFPFGKGLDEKTGYSLGLESAIAFSDRWQLWIDASYYDVKFEINRMDESLGVPVIEPPSDEFTFSKADVPQPFFQYAVGLQYFFNPKGKWKPFLGGAYVTTSLLSYDVTYDFTSEIQGVEWEFEKLVHRNGLGANFLLVRAGLDYEISKHWHLQTKVSYRSPWNDADINVLKLLNMQGGLYYRF